MQSVDEAFSAEEVDVVRRIAQSLQVAWKKDYRPGITLFTIGVSAIGGDDIMPGAAGVQSEWNRYLYNDESDNVLNVGYERTLNMPLGGLVKALADVKLSNLGYTEGGYALVFDGTGDQVNVPGIIMSSTTRITFYARVKVGVGVNGGPIYNDRGVSASTGQALTLGVGTTAAGTSVAGQVYIYLDKSATARGIFTTETINDGQWHDIVAVASGTSGVSVSPSDFSIYIDGSLATANNKTIGSHNWPAVGAGAQRVARHDQWAQSFTGAMDEFAVWEGVAFTASEAASVTTGNVPGDATLYFNFNEGAGSSVADVSGNGYNSVTAGNPTWLQGAQKSGRYTPYYAGGNSELFTAVGLPRRPLVINAGFNYDGTDHILPQFVGVTDKTIKLDQRTKTASLSAVDFIGFLQNRDVDKEEMFTTDRTDVVIERVLNNLGFATAQYDLDEGLNIIKFGLFEKGKKWSDLIDEMVKAEYGHFYQDEEGRLRFENRQHWTMFPHSDVQRILATSQVINQEVPDTDHIINVVEVNAKPRQVFTTQIIWQATSYGGSGIIALPVGNTEVWANYNDPIYAVDTPVRNGTLGQTSFFIANTLTDGTGTDATASVSLKSISNFSQASKMVFTNASAAEVYLTRLDIWGRPARLTGDVYYKSKISSSITAFEEQRIEVENPYIQDSDWARTYAEMILRDFASPENLQELTIRAIPELQMGDLISWQGRSWLVYGIESQIDTSVGFIQKLKLLQRTIIQYFRIGISAIGSTDQISP